MKQYVKSALAIYIAGLLIAVTQPGCKENTIISSGFAPGINNVDIFNVSFPVQTKTQYYDSVITSQALENIYMGIGVMQDPVVGKTNAALYFQVIPGIKNTIYSNYTIDSAFIIIPYSGFTYGDNTVQANQKSYSVYGITDPTFAVNASTGIPNSYFASWPTAAGNYYFTGVNTVSLADSFSAAGINYHPHLRLKIDQNDPRAFQLIRDLEIADSVTSDDPSFTAQFPGLCIQAVDTSSSNHSVAIPYFQLDGDGLTNYDVANVLLYVHDAVGDTTQITFYFSTQYCAHYNKVTHIYNPTALSYFRSSAVSDPNVLLQNGPGGVIDVKIGGIQALVQPDPITKIIKNPIINKASLVFTVSQPTPTTYLTPYLPPFVTYPYSVVSLPGYNVLSEVADRYPVTSTSPLAFIDGTKDSVAPAGAAGGYYKYYYSLNVPRELQLALSNKLDTLHLRINGSSDFWGAYRAIIGGGNNPDTTVRMKFNVVYSKLK